MPPSKPVLHDEQRSVLQEVFRLYAGGEQPGAEAPAPAVASEFIAPCPSGAFHQKVNAPKPLPLFAGEGKCARSGKPPGCCRIASLDRPGHLRATRMTRHGIPARCPKTRLA